MRGGHITVSSLKRKISTSLGSQRVIKQGQRQTVCRGSWGNLTTPQQPTVNSVIKIDYPRLPLACTNPSWTAEGN